ncbi:hypothetical protein JW948_07510 [bacterium]|nr:hypothetical protein [bacterium]
MLNRKLIILLAISLILRVFLVFRTPVSWNPESHGLQAFSDEASHVNYVRYLIQNRSLPVQMHHVQEPDAFVRNEFEYNQPPLAYIFTAVAASAFRISPDGNALLYFCRCFACLLGLITLILFHRFLQKSGLLKSAFFFTMVYALMPVHWRHTSVFGNDVFLWIAVLVLLMLIVEKNRSVSCYTNRFIEGFVLGLGLWIKLSMITVVAAYLLAGMLQKKRWRDWIIPALTGCVIIAPVLIRNGLLYHDVFGIAVSHGPVQDALHTLKVTMIFEFVRGLLTGFVYPFDTLLIPFFLRLPGYVLWICLFGCFTVYYFRLNWLHIREHDLGFPGILSLMIGTAVISVIYYNWWHFQTEFRHIFYMMPLVLWLAAFGLSNGKHIITKGIIVHALVYPLCLILTCII